ncbi:MAG TPA: pentapeptide repeat-containing protein, partial [Steroidobacteraceae bacterium]|nr:pentapeptide repeat-containing protein [Steroidobacteraceae bacterium]
SLFQTNLAQANLTGVVMHEVSLAAADVRGADFTDADLRYATISEINILEMKSFHGMLVSATQQSALLEALGIKVVGT